MVATLSLTNCTEQLDAPVETAKVPFEIVASTVDTKTVNNGVETTWTEGDALNVFHYYSAETGYKSDGKFDLSAENTFSGELSEVLTEEACYNWYAFYPYNEYINTPAERTSGYSVVGGTSSTAQQQNGNNSMAHISGENYPLAGHVEDIEYYAEDPLEIKMTHLTSLLEVVVKNETGKDLTVESVGFTGTEDVVGTYFIDITGEEPAFTKRGDNYVSKTAKLEVSAGEVISNGQSAKFYLAIKPFTANGEVSLVVNNIAKPKTVENVKFSAGTIKTLNYTMLATDFLETSDIEDAIAAEDDEIVQIEGLVVARYAKGFLVQDATGIMLVYTDSTPDVVVGDKVNVTGTKTTYAEMSQLKTPTIKVISQGNTVTYPTPTVLDGAALDAQLAQRVVSYIQYTGKLSVSGSYYNVTVDGSSTAIGSLSYPESTLGLSALNGKGVKVTGYYIGVNSSRYVNTMVVAVEEVPIVADPVITISDAGEVTITCGTEDATVFYTTDGSEPSATNGTAYASAFTVQSGKTVKAIGVKAGALNSKVISQSYVVGVETYQHIFTTKPSIGSITLSEVNWTLNASNLGNYNSGNYAGVQFGTSSKTGEIELTSQNPFTYKGKSTVKEIRLWLNNGSGTISPTVTVGGTPCAQSGTITKNSNAGNDYTNASLVTFTPNADASGSVVINLSCNKAGYFCAIEIDVQ